MDSPIVASLVGALFYYSSDVFAGKLSSNISPLDSNLIRFVYLGIISLLYLIFVSKVSIYPQNTTLGKDYVYILLTALGMGIGNTILVMALNKFKVATIMPYFESFGIILGVTIGYLFFKEHLTINNLFAIILIIFGVFLYKD